MTGRLLHSDGILFKEDKPKAVSYNRIYEIEEVLTPERTRNGEITLEMSENTPHSFSLSPENLVWYLENEDRNWSQENPLHIEYLLDSRINEVDEEPLRDSEPIEQNLDSLFENPNTEDIEEISQQMIEEFSYAEPNERTEVYQMEDFINQRKGICDHFSELVSLINPSWIKQSGYARPGDRNLDNTELDFTRHAWVIDQERATIYDVTPAISNNLDPSWVEREPGPYFIQMPNIQIKEDDERIPEAILQTEGEDKINYVSDYRINQVN